ncbi:hypothetical protein HKK55_28890 [Pseudomonas sp. ADAK18]|uniref:hypothetical protein n=1 Tax=Pseudomonas sp. ADAK18 TaxID=2730848 RepID=UPI001462C9BB|nr:hypothetical protein [Pseudomonas sp. ADAK18]QJI32548.1 hypothetical protein HKK55_28890 [Pseudomonas sp. ADAK18]
MNITKALWVAAAFALVSIAGCTNGQGPTNIAGKQRIENKTAFTLAVMHGTQLHQVAPSQSIELDINSFNITISLANSAGRIDRLVLKYNPGRCPVAHCVEVN